jgi:hypothetical protein
MTLRHDTLPIVTSRGKAKMLLTAITYIGAGIGCFMAMMVGGLLIGMGLTRELPSKAKWDAAGPYKVEA